MKKKFEQLKGLVLAFIIVGSLSTAVYTLTPVIKGEYNYDVKTFSTYNDLFDYLNTTFGNYSGYGKGYEGAPNILFSRSAAEDSLGSSEGGSSVDFSQTNIQVTGVDEPDIVKTDGTYLYILADSTIIIVRAYPAGEAAVLSKITFNSESYPNSLFINDDQLVVFSTSYQYPDVNAESLYCPWWGYSTTIISVYDISDRENPVLQKEIEIDGDYFDARMIDNYVYVIVTEYASQIYRVLDGNATLNIPELCIDGVSKKIPADQIYYIDIPERAETMTHVLAINLDTEEINQQSFLLGSSQTMYVSKHNIFLAYTSYDYYYPLIGDLYSRSEEKTILHRITIDEEDISYVAQGEVPGRVLNQFSMDEYNGYFRIATTIGNVWDTNEQSSNNIYILNEDLEQISEIEDIAPGERIYSARFMGAKAYLVTFKKVDPFFTIDLSDPYNPQVLGKLKIPGYSDYLHPFDENHIIGIGKDTVDPLESNSRGFDFAWYQGLKMALFDISDFENPKEVAKVIIGDRGTDSNALYDHKAFLFDREKELLVIPVRLCEISDEIKQQNNDYTGSIYGDFTFQGAYVYKLSLEDGFELKGRITHLDDEDVLKSGYYGYWGASTITRSLYIDDVLYTISNDMIKMNDLSTLSEINSVQLN